VPAGRSVGGDRPDDRRVEALGWQVSYLSVGDHDTDMNGDCYFCRGIVLPYEDDDVLLEGHADHRVFLHARCAEGHDLVERDEAGGVAVTCPECGAVEHRREGVGAFG
jgi:hypothetical protein